MKKLLVARSLRFWVALGITIALAPLVIATVGGIAILHRGVIVPIHDVAFRQAAQMAPVQRIQILLQDALVAVDEFIEDGDSRHAAAARQLRGQIEGDFTNLIEEVRNDPELYSLISRADEIWKSASDMSAHLVSVLRQPGDVEGNQVLQEFHGAMVATSDQLRIASEQLARDISEDHDAAVLSYERTLWLAGIAAVISLCAMMIGVYLIGRVIGLSVDRLVDGASRFADGDRDHRIAIAVPPELRRVADEFNRMIDRVHETEVTLASLAHVDSLTGLRNRRSFDAEFESAVSRLARIKEPFSLLVLDIDHFKSINDSFGHAGGDEALRQLAKVMNKSLRPHDHVFRIGGEEFAVILSNTSATDAKVVADRLRHAASNLRAHSGSNEIRLTISVGLVSTNHSVEVNEMMSAADAALYRAKSLGRNRVEIDGEFGRSLPTTESTALPMN